MVVVGNRVVIWGKFVIVTSISSSRLRSLPAIRVGVAAIVASASCFAIGQTASAAELAGVITNVVVSPTSLDPDDRVRTDIEFCVPDSAVEGDTFSLTLAEQLTQVPDTIVLNDPSGATVATASIAGDPQVATFTLTSYVDDRVDVCGTAFFESKLSATTTPNSQQTLTYVVGGGATFDIVVDVGEIDTGVDRSTGRKSATFNDPGDQCRTTVESCISWFIESRPGPFDTVRIVDDELTDAEFECDSLSVVLWTLNSDGSRLSRVTPADGTIVTSCDLGNLEVTVTSVPEGVIVRTLIDATPRLPDSDGDTRYTNIAAVTHISETLTIEDNPVRGSVRSSAAGGEASGVIPVTTTTTTSISTTTTSTPTTTSVAVTSTSTSTTTTLPGSGAAVPTTTNTGRLPIPQSPVLPATGTERSMTLIALASLAAGTAMVAGARRRRPAAQPLD